MSRYLNGYFIALAIALTGALSFRAIAEEQDASLPTLGDLMTLTQLRHFKLWYAHKENNWQLAGYEFGQFEITIDRIKKLYPKTSSIAQANLISEKTEPAMAKLAQAIQDKNYSQFESAYMEITSACNQCHQAAGVGFIIVQVPTRSPYSNQNFRPVH